MSDTEIYTLTIKGRPVPKAYGRSGKRYYRKPKVAAQEEKIVTLWGNKYGRDQWMDGEYLAFSLRAFIKDKRHGDLKNYIYLAEDALSEFAYGDDKQILRYDPPPFIAFCNPDEQRTEIEIRKIEGIN